ncbi:MAG: tetratricopeptide repeat protein [Gemmatimonadales bacterium]
MRFRRYVIYCAVSVLVPTGLVAQAGRAKVEQGNKLYADGKYGEARNKYLEALNEVPNSPLIRFDEANTLYETKKYDKAMAAYRDALKSSDSSLQSQSWYNVGNTLYRSQKLEESLEAYKQSLRIDPTDFDAKHNLELVLRKLEDKKQQPKKNDEKKNQQDKQKKQQQQKNDDDKNQNRHKRNQQPQNKDKNRNSENNRQRQQPPPPGRMSRDRAEKLLQAIKEDPNKVKRTLRATRRVKVKKDW